jgi:hypothetical protein
MHRKNCDLVFVVVHDEEKESGVSISGLDFERHRWLLSRHKRSQWQEPALRIKKCLDDDDDDDDLFYELLYELFSQPPVRVIQAQSPFVTRAAKWVFSVFASPAFLLVNFTKTKSSISPHFRVQHNLVSAAQRKPRLSFMYLCLLIIII